MVSARYGPTTYWLSEIAFDSLRADAQSHKISIRGYVEFAYKDWVAQKLFIKDESLRDLWDMRVAQGADPAHDFTLYNAIFIEYGGRTQHTLDLTVDCVAAMALWAMQNKIPQRQRVAYPVGLAAGALEMFGRDWVG